MYICIIYLYGYIFIYIQCFSVANLYQQACICLFGIYLHFHTPPSTPLLTHYPFTCVTRLMRENLDHLVSMCLICVYMILEKQHIYVYIYIYVYIKQHIYVYIYIYVHQTHGDQVIYIFIYVYGYIHKTCCSFKMIIAWSPHALYIDIHIHIHIGIYIHIYMYIALPLKSFSLDLHMSLQNKSHISL